MPRLVPASCQDSRVTVTDILRSFSFSGQLSSTRLLADLGEKVWSKSQALR